MLMNKQLLTIIAALFGLLAGWVSAEEKPNIIFLLADDQRNDVLGCYGNEFIQTPTLDRLAAQGVRFENAFCEVPICAASRATILSGLTQRTHGYNFREPPVPAEYVATSYPAMLKAAGYRVGFAGKYGTAFAGQGVKNISKRCHHFCRMCRNSAANASSGAGIHPKNTRSTCAPVIG